jgi:hypothetical protein
VPFDEYLLIGKRLGVTVFLLGGRVTGSNKSGWAYAPVKQLPTTFRCRMAAIFCLSMRYTTHIAGDAETPEIDAMETRWRQKLQSREMGLNRH